MLPFRFGKRKKEQNDYCQVNVGKKQYWNLKYQIPDLILFPHVNESNIANAETG